LDYTRKSIGEEAMKVLIVTQYFPPEMGAPQARLHELGTRLKAMGHEITVLTALPNYPTGRIFEGYRWRVKVKEVINGMKVVRTCLYPSKSGKTLPRLLSYLSFGFSSVLPGVWGISRQDVVLIESPPLFLVPFALLISRIVRGKAVMMVSDIWPDIIVRMGHASEKSLSVKAMLWLERLAYNHSYAVALTNPGAVKQIRERFAHLKNITVISNGVDTKMFSPEFRNEEVRCKYGAGPDDFLVGYCGLHGLAQGLEVILHAATKLRDRSDIKLIMIGDGPTKEELVRKSRELNLTNLRFCDRRSKSEMPELLASLDASLVPLSARFPGTMPSKVYEALASGTPPIVAKGCEAETLVVEFEVGQCYEPGDANEMADAILYLAEDRPRLQKIRENCIKLSKRFDRDIIAERTENILTTVHEGRQLPEVAW
jgi:glycosyltransferase involved in cell wall biosynthesis